MKRILTIITLSLLAWSLQGQDILKKIGTDRITCAYTYETSGSVKVKTAGEAVLQGSCYRIDVNGMRLYCDGETLWTVDPSTREVYIEKAEKVDFIREFLANSRDVTYGQNTVKGTFVDPSDGVDIAFELSDITFEPATGDLSAFRFSADGAADYIITDLR